MFYRVGFAGDLYILKGKWEFLPFFMHGYDNVFLGTSTPANQALPAGARAPAWNGGFIESHYYVNSQLVFTGRWELVRMSRQAFPAFSTTPGAQTLPADLGNVDAYSFGYRWYPIMFSRAGLAWHNEYSIAKTRQITLLSAPGTKNVWSSSLFFGFDFDF